MHAPEPSSDHDDGDSPSSTEQTATELARSTGPAGLGALARIALGERPVFPVHWRWDGTAVEITVDDLPGVRAYAPTRADVERAAHHRIAAELHLPTERFDVLVVDD